MTRFLVGFQLSKHLAQLFQFIEREFAEGGLDVVFLFGEGAEGVGMRLESRL